MTVNGFEKAYANMMVEEFEKKSKKDFINAKVNELVAQGLERKVARVLIETQFEYGLISECGFEA